MEMANGIKKDGKNDRELEMGRMRSTSRSIKSILRWCFHKPLAMLVLVFLLQLTLVPPATSAQPHLKPDLFSVSFPTVQKGWACGRLGTIVHTSDGGESWQYQNSHTPFTLTAISFPDANNGWAVGDGGTILHTSDGGKHWSKQDCPYERYLMDVQFVSQNKGWAVGEGTSILYTDDGGKTWTVQFQDVDFILKSISFCDESNGWAVGEYGYIYRTQNAGQTWVQQGGYFGFSETTGEIQGGNFLFDAMAVDPMTCWVVGIDGYVSKTDDGGQTWTALKSNVPRTHLFSIMQGRQGDIFLAGNGMIMAGDSSARFRRVNTTPTIKYGWIYGLTPKGKDGFVAVGRRGWIYQGDGTKAVSLN